jgi:hypothetical protein
MKAATESRTQIWSCDVNDACDLMGTIWRNVARWRNVVDAIEKHEGSGIFLNLYL